MNKMKFGAIISPCHPGQPELNAGGSTLATQIEQVMLLEHLGYNEVWMLEGMDEFQVGTAEFEQFIYETSRATKRISFGVGINPIGTPTVIADKIQWLNAQNLATPLKLSVASQVSPLSATIAGIHGLGLLSIGATTLAGFSALPSHWEIYDRKTRENDHHPERSNWALVGPTHLAKTRKQAKSQVSDTVAKWLEQHSELGLSAEVHEDADPVEVITESGLAVIGTSRDAIDQIKRLQTQTGGFGTYLLPMNKWADLANTKASLELFAKHLFPRFQATDQS